MVTCNSAQPPSSPGRSVRLRRLFTLLLWALVLAYLSLASEVKAAANLQIWDKFSHFAAYAVMTLLWGRYLLLRWQGPLPWLVAGGGAFSYGLVMELLQWAMRSGRSAEWGDLLANSLGALLVCVLFCLVRGRSSLTNDR